MILPIFLPIIVHVLSENDSKGFLVELALVAIKDMFKKARKRFNNKDNEVTRKFEDLKGIDALEKLQYHPSISVYEKALQLLLKNFDKESTFPY